MAKKLENKTNTPAPNSTYPYSRIQDEIQGSQSGTPVNREVYNSLHQLLERMMDWAGVTHNGLEDNADDGFQYFEALALLSEKQEVESRGTSIEVETIGATDLIQPGDMFVDFERAHLYVLETDSSNTRIFCYNINTQNRITSLETSLSSNYELGGLYVKDQIAFIPNYNTNTDQIDLISYDLANQASLDSLTLWDSSQTDMTASFSNKPDCHAIDHNSKGNVLYVSKGDIADTGTGATYNSEIKAVDISDPSNMTDQGVVATSPTVDDAYTGIEVVAEEEVFYAGLTRNADIELYDLSQGYTSPNKVETFTNGSGPFHIIADKLYIKGGTSGDQSLNVLDRHTFNELKAKAVVFEDQSGSYSYIKDYHYPTIDNNGYKNYKIFVTDDANGQIIVLERSLNTPIDVTPLL